MEIKWLQAESGKFRFQIYFLFVLCSIQFNMFNSLLNIINIFINLSYIQPSAFEVGKIAYEGTKDYLMNDEKIKAVFLGNK